MSKSTAGRTGSVIESERREAIIALHDAKQARDQAEADVQQANQQLESAKYRLALAGEELGHRGKLWRVAREKLEKLDDELHQWEAKQQNPEAK